jgi:hypothetical protein
MPRPNLVHLETLCWIARLGTFTAAADRLHTAQSAISARMKELERSLGVPIFQHRGSACGADRRGSADRPSAPSSFSTKPTASLARSAKSRSPPA